MILKLSTETLYLTNLLIVLGYCYNTIEHPEMRQYYLEIRRNRTDVTPKQSDRDSALVLTNKVEILAQCEKIADKNMYRLIEVGEPMNKSGIVTKDLVTKKEIMTFFRSERHTLEEINLQVPDIGDVLVFQCAENEEKIIYIENMKYMDFFIFEKNKTNNNIEIKMAVFPLQFRWSTKQRLLNVLEYNVDKENKNVVHKSGLKVNENEFIKGLLGKSGTIQQCNDICDLKNFGLFQLCASVFYFFKIWITGKVEVKPPAIHEIRRPTNDVTCINLPVTLLAADYRLLEESEKGRKIIHLKALPCAVNSEWDQPNFYVIPNNLRPRPTFHIIEKIKENYYITMKMRNTRGCSTCFKRRKHCNCFTESNINNVILQ